MSRNTLNHASRSDISHRRTNSAPTPTIEVEDVSRPLTSIEDLDEEPAIRPVTKSHTAGTLGAGHRHARKPAPNVAWRKKWSHEHDPFKDGRVLIVDLLSREQSDDKRRQTQAHELTNLNELSSFYEKSSERKIKPCLRIVHVQNSLWARSFLFKKYGIINPEKPDLDRPGNAFSRWAMWEKPQKRAGRPVLNAKPFSVDKSPLRNIWRTGFGVDYLRYFTPGHMAYSLGDRGDASNHDEFKLLELNKWIEAEGYESYSAHGWDVYVQRLSVYIQRNMDDAGLINEDWRSSTGTYAPRDSEELERLEATEKEATVELQESVDEKSRKKWQDLRDSFDNGTTIIVFESSHSGLVRDTLIEARAEIEKKWRRIFTDLPRDDIETDSLLALECLDFALNYILQGLTQSWEKFLSKCEEHVEILEEKIYESPADESRAPELWTNQSLWLKIEKLLFVQMETVNTFRQYLRDVSVDGREFLKEIPDHFKRLETLIEEELTKPTANLNDLVYKSVEIRDSRQSIQLGISMWRLSWITFIFLPLTFISGFFGMNVDIFQPDGGFPSIKWYFVASIPLMLLVVLSYYMLKNTLSIRRDDPLRRGTFENIYDQFASEHPQLWSRNGPRDYIRPRGPFSRVKWFLVCHWFAPHKTIAAAKPLLDINDMGMFERIKHILAKKWLHDIKVHYSDMLSTAERGESEGDFGPVMELIEVATRVAVADGSPQAASEIASSSLRRKRSRHRGSSRSSSRSTRRGYFRSSSPGRRSGSPASEGMVCEEEDGENRGDGDDDDDDDDDDSWDRGRIEMEERAERRREREEDPTGEGASSLLAIPPVSRQVLTRTRQSEP